MKPLSRLWPAFIPLFGGLMLLGIQLWANGNATLWYAAIFLILFTFMGFYLWFELPKLKGPDSRKAALNALLACLPLAFMLLHRLFPITLKPLWLTAFFVLTILLCVRNMVYRKEIFSQVVSAFLICAMLYAIYVVNMVEQPVYP